MSAAVRGRPARRLDKPMVAVLEKRGRFLVAEPLFGPGPRTAVERGGAGAGDLVLVGARQARRARAAPARPARPGARRGRGADARPRPAPLATRARRARRRRPRSNEPYAADARVDLRDLPTFTIDPDDARDFDDAISARREDGRVRLWVHIADVTAYVRPGGRLEREAFRRGTSVYVPGAVEPMLPEVLSNRGLLAAAGRGQARRDGRDGDGRRGRDERGLPPLARAERPAAHLRRGGRAVRRPHARRGALGRAARSSRARWRRALRERRDSLEFGSWEPTFEFDSDGNVTGVRYEQQTESHRLIEMLMILANEQVAGYLADKRLPTLYRVHERPEPQSVDVPGRAAREPRHPDAAAAEADDAPAGRRRGHRDLADRGARVAAASAPTACSCCAR